MLNDVYFQIPKLGFLLFFFLACDSLCPLKREKVFFPHTYWLGMYVQHYHSWWIWITKWSMISFFIIALMSPVKERIELIHPSNELLIVMPEDSLNKAGLEKIHYFLLNHKNFKIGFLILKNPIIKIPITMDHEVLYSMLKQITPRQEIWKTGKIDVKDFFSDTVGTQNQWVLCFSDQMIQKLIVNKQVQIKLIEENDSWEKLVLTDQDKSVQEKKVLDYYYHYPLFFGFLNMLLYLYARNQKGLR